MLLADETVNEMVNQLCTVERDVKVGAVGKTYQEALVVKPVVQKTNHQSKLKTPKQKGKQSGNCNYCHEPGLKTVRSGLLMENQRRMQHRTRILVRQMSY